MNKKKWEEAVVAWEKVKLQAQIDLEQSEFYLKHIREKIKGMK